MGLAQRDSRELFREEDKARLLSLVREVTEELASQKVTMPIGLDSKLNSELGIDSLGRVELMLRLEREFGVAVPEEIALSADTPGELWQALGGIHGHGSPQVVLGARTVDREVKEITAFPDSASTLEEVLQWHVERHPQRQHIYLYEDGGAELEISYEDLLTNARAVACGLRRTRFDPGQTVALMLPTGRDFFYAFLGVLLAGGVPVPIYPPVSFSRIEDHLLRQSAILRNAQAVALVTVEQAKTFAHLLKSLVPALQAVVTREELAAETNSLLLAKIAPEQTAFIQYTSGSTGLPKGVVLNHTNLLANIRAMGQALDIGSSDVFVSWLPLYHDMGLIGAWLGNLYFGSQLVVMSPLAFIARPYRWLQMIHNHQGTISCAPNFAYEICASKVEDSSIEGLDLSSWRLALNGAEPVLPLTVERFIARFSNYGFRRSAMCPVYGLAENSVGLSFPQPGRGHCLDRVKRSALEKRAKAEPADAEDSTALQFVGCGQPLPGHEIRVISPMGCEVGEREVGRLQFRGPSATKGYFQNAKATEELYSGQWLESGDYAYFAEGELFITGRSKDMIIRGGRNIYPHELEQLVGDIPGIRKGCVAAFGVPGDESGKESLVVVAETREQDRTKRAALIEETRKRAADLLQIVPDQVVLIPPRVILKTSSGKIRRAGTKALYLQGKLEKPGSSLMQFVRITAASALPLFRRARHFLAELSYAIYAYLLFAVVTPLTWLLVSICPSTDLARRVFRNAARFLLFLTGTPISVKGLIENLPRDHNCVLVANHASYLDSLILMAVLPPRFSFVAKKELSRQFFPRVLLGAIKALYVERYDHKASLEDTETIHNAVKNGSSVVFFPEGTFCRAPGLMPFRMGAFKIAAECRVPLVPIAIRGTRSILYDVPFIPRRCRIAVSILEPVQPQGSNWSELIKLRSHCRSLIASACGEPDLA